LLDERHGAVSVAFTGVGAKELFKNESGGHRWQRLPPTEKRGRVHTSTVTVAVLDPDVAVGKTLDERDVEITTTKGSGPGGQKRNKTESCVVAIHKPSGITVRIDMRSQYQGRSMAMKVLSARLYQLECEKINNEKDTTRKQQVGSGMRGDKIRTYRSQDDQVTDHRTGEKWRLKDWLRGDWR